MKPTVLILGAAGRIGQVLATNFAQAGWTVRAQARKPLPDALAALPQIQPVRCDALDGGALRDAAQGASVVIHALNPLYSEWDRLALPLVDAAIDAARSSGALLMLPGNVYNYGREIPPVLTPNTPERGDTPKARIRIEAEARIAAASGIDSVVIRAGDFFGGPGRGSWLDLALATRLKSRRFVYPGPAHLAHAWAYLPDLAQAFVRVAEKRELLHGHRRLHFAGHTASGDELRQSLEAVIGRPLRIAGMPWSLIRIGGLFVPTWREVAVMRYLWQRPHRLDGSELEALAGPLPHTPLPHALAAALGELDLLPQPALAGFTPLRSG
jgi:nucleoside-diphosphate-sugar epimerase